MRKQKKDNLTVTNNLIKTLENNFSNEKFEKADKLIHNLIDNNLKRVFELNESYEKLDVTFDYYWRTEKLVSEIYKLSKKYEINFYSTRTFRAYIRNTLFTDLKENNEIDFINNLEKYLSAINKTNMMANARVATEVINATRIKRYKFYKKVKMILEKYSFNYDLTPFEEFIKNKKTMNKDMFFMFINVLNNLKIERGIIPSEICEYLICQMLEQDSQITLENRRWVNLRECVFCDFISNIQEKNFHTKDNLNYVMNLGSENINGRYRKNKKIICIDDSIIYNFSNDNIKAIVTTFHELRHFEQAYYTKKNNYFDGRYRILKEKIIEKHMSGFSKKNYWILYNEIDARKHGLLKAIQFIEKMGIDIKKLKINKNNASILFEEYKKITIEDCEKSLYDNFQKLHVQRRLIKLLKENPKILKNYPILKYEFNEDGSRKKFNEVVKKLENDYVAKEINKNNLIEILNYSIFDEEYITRSQRVTNFIMKYNFDNISFERICIKTLFEKLQKAMSRTQFNENTEDAIKVSECLKKQIVTLKLFENHFIVV